MPFIKRYPDGSVFDYTNGHRTAEQVARQKAEGTYSEPTSEDSKVGRRATTAFFLAFAAAAALSWTVTQSIMHEKQNQESIVSQLEERVNGKVLDSKNKDVMLLRISQDHPPFPGETAEEHSSHPDIVTTCEAEKFVENEEGFAAIFCEGMSGSLVVPLPHK